MQLINKSHIISNDLHNLAQPRIHTLYLIERWSLCHVNYTHAMISAKLSVNWWWRFFQELLAVGRKTWCILKNKKWKHVTSFIIKLFHATSYHSTFICAATNVQKGPGSVWQHAEPLLCVSLYFFDFLWGYTSKSRDDSCLQRCSNMEAIWYTLSITYPYSKSAEGANLRSQLIKLDARSSSPRFTEFSMQELLHSATKVWWGTFRVKSIIRW